MLEELENQVVGEYRIRVESIGRARYFDQRDFAIYLIDARGSRSDAPVFRGRFNTGRPSISVPAWIDGEFVEDALEGERRAQARAQVMLPALRSDAGLT